MDRSITLQSTPSDKLEGASRARNHSPGLRSDEQVVLTDGATAQTLINKMVATPKELLAEARAIISE